jgi:hypothetical protein
MPLYRTQVELAATSGNALDKATNVWHFIADDLTALNLALTQVTTFYNAIDGQMSGNVAATGHRIRCYDLSDPEPRAPVVDQGLAGMTLGTTRTAPELAICVSFQAPRQSGVSQARRRGRLYLGPWKADVVDSTNGFPSAGALGVIGGAVQTLLDASQAAATWAWAVYSPTNAVAIEVTDAWLDNAFDVQRRRGVTATTRTTFV